MPSDLKRIEIVEESWDWKEYLYEYKGHKIREIYFHEEDCNHHSAVIYDKDGKELEQFNWGSCMKDAMEYIDKLVESEK